MGGVEWIPAMAGPMHPPFSLLRKERMRRARWKRENEDAQEVLPPGTQAFCPRRRASGSFGGRRIDFLLFPLPLTWRLRQFLLLPHSLSVPAASAAADREAGPFDNIQTPARTTPRTEDFRITQSVLRRVPVTFLSSFSLFHRARRILSFSPERKRENGGCNAPASILAESFFKELRI